jgi:hypothetical protein
MRSAIAGEQEWFASPDAAVMRASETAGMEVLEQLSERGLVHQATDLEGLRGHLRQPRRIACTTAASGSTPAWPSWPFGR